MQKILFGIKTRQKVMISSFILTILYLILQRVDFISLLSYEAINFDFFQPLTLAVFTFILMYWIVDFRIGGERFFTILGFPAVGVFVFSLFVELIINTLFGQLGILFFVLLSGIIFYLFTYILFLTSNVLNVSYLRDIPLGQAGRAAYFILNLFIGYLLISIIITNSILILIQFVLIFISIFFIVSSTLWTIKERLNRRILVSFLISFFITFAYFVLAMWPIDTTYISFILMVLVYITLGVALEIHERINRMIWVEYGLLYLIIFILLLIISSWGINGEILF